MKILIVLNQPYPNGMACTGRVKLYARAFKHEGHHVEILLPKAKKQNREFGNNISSGKHEEIQYTCFTSSSLRNRFLLIRAFYDIWGPLHCLFYVIKSRPGVILLVSSSFYHKIVFALGSVVTGSLIIHEKSEIPFRNKPESARWRRKMQSIYLSCLNSIFHGHIMISERLEKYFRDNVNKHIRSIVVPVIINRDEMDFSPKSSRDQFNLVYSGNFTQRQDGVISILESFSLVSKRYPEIRMTMLGGINSSSDKNEIFAFLNKYKLTSKIKILGYVSRDELIDQYQKADALILAKPLNRQNIYNFPTKLAEYLSTGKPVITTAVGSIDTFLHDSKNAFIARSENAADLAEKIELVINDPILSGKVGEEGKKTVQELFDYLVNGKRITSFFESLIKIYGKLLK